MLRIAGLKKRFGDKTVLDGLELSVPKHSIFGFIGKNGAGKTTTMKLILGRLQADDGSIFVADEPVHYGGTSVNRQIGYLPDVPEYYGFLTAREYLALCGEISRMEREDIRLRTAELLELVGLSGERHRIRGYSRGMKQRLGIAQALLSRPKLLICDEPTSALDPAGRKEILDLLYSLREYTTVLFSTHILSDVERICTDAAFLANGKVRLQGSMNQLLAAHRSATVLLELSRAEDCLPLLQTFPALQTAGETQLRFSGSEDTLFELLRFLAAQRIPLLRLERTDSTLESLFMEVAES